MNGIEERQGSRGGCGGGDERGTRTTREPRGWGGLCGEWERVIGLEERRCTMVVALVEGEEACGWKDKNREWG